MCGLQSCKEAACPKNGSLSNLTNTTHSECAHLCSYLVWTLICTAAVYSQDLYGGSLYNLINTTHSDFAQSSCRLHSCLPWSALCTTAASDVVRKCPGCALCIVCSCVQLLVVVWGANPGNCAADSHTVHPVAIVQIEEQLQSKWSSCRQTRA